MGEEEQARGAPEGTPPYSAQQGQARRIEALRTLAQANATRHDAASPPDSPARARRGSLVGSIRVGDTFRTERLGWLGRLAWSPDGTELALPIIRTSNDQPYAYQPGVGIVPARGGQPRVLLDPTFVSTAVTATS